MTDEEILGYIHIEARLVMSSHLLRMIEHCFLAYGYWRGLNLAVFKKYDGEITEKGYLKKEGREERNK